MMRFRALFILIILPAASLVFAGGGILGGTVRNDWEDALVGTYIRILNQPLYAVVGQMNGSYEIREIPVGSCDVLYFFPAYDSLLVKNVTIAEDSTTILHVILTLADPEGTTADTVDLMPVASDSLETDSATADGESE